MITPLLILSGIGLIMAGLLAIGRKIFAVEIDARQDMLMDILPGANCGGCGYPGCSGYAAALIEGKASPANCPPGGDDLAEQIGKILGIAVAPRERTVALIRCAGDNNNAPARSTYLGIADCNAAHAVAGGSKACTHGCLGFGTCADACVFDAIITSDNGLCYVDPQRCTGCGKCIEACPRKIIEMVRASEQVHVLCINPNKAKDVKAVCSVGCTGCKLCQKQSKRFSMSGSLAFVDPDSEGDIPESAALACGPGAIWDNRHYTTKEWVDHPASRANYTSRSNDWKASEKMKKAAAKAAKAKKTNEGESK